MGAESSGALTLKKRVEALEVELLGAKREEGTLKDRVGDLEEHLS